MPVLSTTKRSLGGARRSLRVFRAGWPGGFDTYSLGTTTGSRAEDFHPSTDPNDPRSLISPLGLREYWYPLCPDKSVGSKRPTGVRILGEDLVVWRNEKGEVSAANDVCPHRGVRLSFGTCAFKGYLSCGYHGATFDGDGNCVEFITEGPDSKMVGAISLHARPTVTLKDVVFVWMGEGVPVPIEEDVPPEFFEKDTIVKTVWRYWHCNWLVALENTHDSHNAGWVHRLSVRLAFTRYGGRPRTPFGSRPSNVENKAVDARSDPKWGKHYADENGKIPLRMYYPRVDGYWPHHSWRLATAWLFDLTDRFSKWHVKPFETPEEWVGQRIPGMVRHKHRGPWRSALYTRWGIPVEENMTRAFYMHSVRPKTVVGRVWEWLSWPALNFLVHFNFSDQDYDAMRTARYDLPENLSSTDSLLVLMRKTFADHQRRPNIPGADGTSADGDQAAGSLANGAASGYGNGSNGHGKKGVDRDAIAISQDDVAAPSVTGAHS